MLRHKVEMQLTGSHATWLDIAMPDVISIGVLNT